MRARERSVTGPTTPTTDEEAYAQGMVPTRVVAPLLRRGLLVDFGEDFHTSGAAGSLPRILHRWENEQEYVEFNSVDSSLAKVNMVHSWREDEPESYFRPVIPGLGRSPVRRCQRAGCSNEVVPHPKGTTKKRFCSNRCYRAWWTYHQRDNPRLSPAGPGRKLRDMVCAKGLHDMSGDNVRTRPGGARWCHACKLAAQRAYRAK